MCRKLICLTLLLTLPLLGFAASYQSLADIKKQVKAFVSAQFEQDAPGEMAIRVGYLDPRLQLPQCEKDKLKLFFPPGQQHMRASNVGVRCRHQKPWTIYVPVRIYVTSQIIVASRPLARGHQLQESDVKLARYDINRLNYGYLQTADMAIGKILKQPLIAGAPVQPKQLKSPLVIRRGEAVKIVVKTPSFQVAMQGVALSDGKQGQMIKIRNLQSKRVIEARVVGPQQVQILWVN